MNYKFLGVLENLFKERIKIKEDIKKIDIIKDVQLYTECHSSFIFSESMENDLKNRLYKKIRLTVRTEYQIELDNINKRVYKVMKNNI